MALGRRASTHARTVLYDTYPSGPLVSWKNSDADEENLPE